MSENTPVIGFDVGHGESALTIIDDAYTLRGKNGIQPRPVFTVKSQPTVLATLKNGRKAWGFNALRQTKVMRDEVSEFEICFKAKPGREQTDAVIQEFAACVLADARSVLNGQLNNRAQWFIGCPSAWDQATQTAYGRIFSRAGFGTVAIVKESRAAFTYHFEKDDGFTIRDLQAPTVVLDFGSSTLDATLAIGLRDDELDPGCPLGATWIDKAILHWNLKHCSRDDFPGIKQDGEKIAAFLAANRFERNLVEFEVRKAKEQYFNAMDTYDATRPYEHVPIKLGAHRLWIVIYGEMMRELLTSPLEEVVPELRGDGVPDDVKVELVGRSWLGRCQKFLEDIGRKLEDRGIKRADIGRVLLTGGASRMQPVRQLVQEFFVASQMLDEKRDGEGKLQYDTEPEMCIARGLACWGRTAVQGESFRDEVSTLLFGQFDVTDDVLTALRQAKVPEPVIAKLEPLKSLPETKRHPDGFLAALEKALDKDDLAKFQDLIVEHTPLLNRRLLEITFKQYEAAKFEDIVGDKWAEIALSRLRSWHNKNTSRSNLGPSIARELRHWSTSGELDKVIKSRVERLETAIRKEVNALVEPRMKRYQISNVTFMERTPLFEKMVPYYKSDAEKFAKYMEGNTAFADLDDSWWTRWMVVSDSDLETYVKNQQRFYSSQTYKELYEDKDNLNLFWALIFVPVGQSIERAIIATQYLIAADMEMRSG